MIALLQRVSAAHVSVDKKIVGRIEKGLLALVGIEKGDTEQQTQRLLERILGYRVFGDKSDKMNLSITDIKGGLLLVPQFTLAADTQKGMRPSFAPAAAPAMSEALFNALVAEAHKKHSHVATGQFGANMQVSLTNDGPVTFWLRVTPKR
ncbi:MAG TPA: D-tyrosyl-tRNA(Tyr) deacylase [Gammaproteobacteria bacterium]|nr:D-tyrosyl-tRNA(Tyr) deacylase [Gammaproteobacteria bacterium]